MINIDYNHDDYLRLPINTYYNFAGDIHLNELMTWSDKVYTEDEVRLNDYLKPNLYSIALHEFGHSLGLR